MCYFLIFMKLSFFHRNDENGKVMWRTECRIRVNFCLFHKQKPGLMISKSRYLSFTFEKNIKCYRYLRNSGRHSVGLEREIIVIQDGVLLVSVSLLNYYTRVRNSGTCFVYIHYCLFWGGFVPVHVGKTWWLFSKLHPLYYEITFSTTFYEWLTVETSRF